MDILARNWSTLPKCGQVEVSFLMTAGDSRREGRVTFGRSQGELKQAASEEKFRMGGGLLTATRWCPLREWTNRIKSPESVRHTHIYLAKKESRGDSGGCF